MSWTLATQGAAAAAQSAPDKPDAPAAAMSSANILVVDDQPEKLLVYQTVLAEIGENIVTATSGAEALRLMLHMEFAVVLLDVNMPIIDGFETAALIRSRKKLAHTPIIFVTAFGDDMHAAQGYSLGAVDYILTPIIPEVLCTKVRVFVELYRMTLQVRQQAEDRIQLVRAQAAQAAAEAAIQRAAFLAEASRELSGSLGVEAAAERLVHLVVPFVSDLCALVLVDESGATYAVKAAWRVASHDVAPLQSTAGSRLLDSGIRVAVEQALAQNACEPIQLRDVGGTLRIGVTLRGEEAVEAGVGLAHAALFPLAARGRTLGVLVLGFAGGRSFGSAENAFASELAGRVATALDNARLYSRIREADRRKDEFLAMLAHELRNPLAPIRNAVEIMRLRNGPDAAPDSLCEVIGKEVAHMSRLVDDLLDVSRINRGKITLKRSSVDIVAILAVALESKRAALASRGQTLEVALPDAPLWIDGDPVRLHQIIVNLMDNAGKFTPEGGHVWVGVHAEGAWCAIHVRDNGIGMAPELVPEIFHLFTQGERSLDRRMGGLGIGLSVVKDLVDLHGGTVHARSDGPDQGSEFVVRLPLLAQPPVARPAPCAGAQAPASQRILVVDDHVDAVLSLAMLLRMHGHTVETAHTGADALRLAPTFRPRLAVLDIGLPGMDGYQLAEKLLELPEMHGTTLIAVTGYGQSEDMRRSAAAGFQHHLVKPVEPATLLAIINALDHPEPR